jgi:hypothetical protein
MEKNNLLCKRIAYKAYGDSNKPKILLGIVIKEDSLFLYFRTAKKNYMISKASIISLEDTTEVFHNE